MSYRSPDEQSQRERELRDRVETLLAENTRLTASLTAARLTADRLLSAHSQKLASDEEKQAWIQFACAMLSQHVNRTTRYSAQCADDMLTEYRKRTLGR